MTEGGWRRKKLSYNEVFFKKKKKKGEHRKHTVCDDLLVSDRVEDKIFIVKFIFFKADFNQI
jgi:hypothetical protein